MFYNDINDHFCMVDDINYNIHLFVVNYFHEIINDEDNQGIAIAILVY